MLSLRTLFVISVFLYGGLACTQNPPQAPAPIAPDVLASAQQNCHAMNPTQPALDTACVQRWTVGTPMPDPDPMTLPWTSAQTSNDPTVRLVYGCAQMLGVTAMNPVPPDELVGLLTCIARHRESH